MYAKIYGETTRGINGEEVIVEVDVSSGLPKFELVGLANAAVREARERVKAAVKNSGFPFPHTRITVNLAPANVQKEGSGLDLPIALGIIACSGQLKEVDLEEYIFVGELSLDGQIRPVTGVLPMLIKARELGKKAVFIPLGNQPEGELVEGIKVFVPQTLNELLLHLVGEEPLAPLEHKVIATEVYQTEVDFSDVQGQMVAKRALEIAAAGGHNVLMVGSPGAGKTMLARRLSTILPPLTEEEALEVTKIYSIAGLLAENGGLIRQRPFRSPHHTVSQHALVGGGSIPKPGEVTLSHHGVLFLDELPEFSRSALEVLRQPLEDGEVCISRVHASFSFPANIILITAMNSCPCGYHNQEDAVHKCSCSPREVENYRKKISGPLLDRIDIQIQVPRLEFKEMKDKTKGETSSAIRNRVISARKRQLARLAGTGFYCNGQMGHREIKGLCAMTAEAETLLEKYFNVLSLSARSHDRIIKVARTIADLDGSNIIEARHLGEAVQLRLNT